VGQNVMVLPSGISLQSSKKKKDVYSAAPSGNSHVKQERHEEKKSQWRKNRIRSKGF